MTSLRYRILNVFTQRLGRLTGNPLCVFEDASALDAQTMQALARQFNLSETTFLLPSQRADARVRIFTPAYEMAFAGHPTLGTAHVVRALKRLGEHITLEMQAGVIAVAAHGQSFSLEAVAPSFRAFTESKALLARALGLVEQDLLGPPLWVKAGKEQLMIPLQSERAVRSVALQPELCRKFKSEDGESMAYVFAELGQGRVLARFFFENGESMLEDPATGSAAANLGGYFLHSGRALPLRFSIEQGEYVARLSSLQLQVTEARRIFVAGDVVELAAGSLAL